MSLFAIGKCCNFDVIFNVGRDTVYNFVTVLFIQTSGIVIPSNYVITNDALCVKGRTLICPRCSVYATISDTADCPWPS